MKRSLLSSAVLVALTMNTQTLLAQSDLALEEIVADGALDFLNQTGFVNEPAFWGLEFAKKF